MRGEQGLVRGDDIFAGGDRLQDEAARGLIAAEQFRHDIDVGARDQRGGVASNQFGVDAECGNRLEAAIGDADQLERCAELALEHRGVGAQQPHDALADRAAAEQG